MALHSVVAPISVRTVIVCETSAKFLLISYSSSFGIQIKNIYSVFGDSFWPPQVGRTATKLSHVTQNSLHCPLPFIPSRRDRAEKRLRMRETCRSFMLIFCSICSFRSTFCLSGLCQEMDLRTQWIHCYLEFYVQE